MLRLSIVFCREIWDQSKQSFKEKKIDIHTRLMRRYKEVPEWWFWCILAINISVTIFACEYYIDQLQLPWWGVLLACSVAIIFTLPIGILTAITNQVKQITKMNLSKCYNQRLLKCYVPIHHFHILKDDLDYSYVNLFGYILYFVGSRIEHYYRIYHRIYLPRIPSRKYVL